MNTWHTKSGYKIYQVLSGRSNVFLLAANERNILIDTGTKNKWNRLKKKLIHLNIHKIDYLIVTHAHFDHAGNAAKVKDYFGTSVIVHRTEASCLISGKNSNTNGSNIFTRFLFHIAANKIIAKLKYPPCRCDILMDSVFDLKTLGLNAYILHTPGHTTGSVSVIIDNEIAIAGDTLFGVFYGSVYPPFAKDVAEMIHSWGKLIATNCHLFIPSHGTANTRELVQKGYSKRKTKNK
jgi:glyoxylase-like metal-dependent hydrolase (beta-lactamase superfamily II)